MRAAGRSAASCYLRIFLSLPRFWPQLVALRHSPSPLLHFCLFSIACEGIPCKILNFRGLDIKILKSKDLSSRWLRRELLLNGEVAS